jgi:hypothetical protein
MKALPSTATDDEIFAFLDGWMDFLKREEYQQAFGYVDYFPGSGWTPKKIRGVVKGGGSKQKTQLLIIRGPSSSMPREKKLLRWKRNRDGYIGTVIYPVHLDGLSFKLNAAFLIHLSGTGITLQLNDIFEV